MPNVLIETTVGGGMLCTVNYGTHTKPFVSASKRYVFSVNAIAALEDLGDTPYYIDVDAPSVRQRLRITFTSGHVEEINMSIGEFLAKLAHAGSVEYAAQGGDIIVIRKERQ